jgi:prepilin-type N-terminal cleavage/methylation domain-containing protein
MIRRGMTLMELVVACVLLGTLLVVCLQLLGAVAALWRSTDQRQAALIELQNVLDRVAARPWADLTEKNLAAERVSDSVKKLLTDAELKIEVSEPALLPPLKEHRAKRIAVSLRWRDFRSGQFLDPVTIATWRYEVE